MLILIDASLITITIYKKVKYAQKLSLLRQKPQDINGNMQRQKVRTLY